MLQLAAPALEEYLYPIRINLEILFIMALLDVAVDQAGPA